jgi:hypothetical protein
MSNYWVRVENNQVVECLSYLPERAGDWRQAIDVVPALIPNRQIVDGHTFDLTKNPVEIVWSVKNLEVQERKESLLDQLTGKEKQAIQNEIMKELTCSCANSSHCCLETLTDNVNALRQKRNEIVALNTHEEVDAYMANNPV